MNWSSIFTKALKLSLALMIATPLIMATDASAQRNKRKPYVSKAYKKKFRRPARISRRTAKKEPWQKALDRLYHPGNQQSEADKVRRILFRDPGKVLGLPSNGIVRPKKPNVPVVALVTLDPVVSHLDSDGNGSISRSEYFQGRSRLSNLGVKAGRNNQRRTQRLGSQFRETDFNGDGKVTPEELQARGSGRF